MNVDQALADPQLFAPLFAPLESWAANADVAVGAWQQAREARAGVS